jgi:hypothetical protein
MKEITNTKLERKTDRRLSGSNAKNDALGSRQGGPLLEEGSEDASTTQRPPFAKVLGELSPKHKKGSNEDFSSDRHLMAKASFEEFESFCRQANKDIYQHEGSPASFKKHRNIILTENIFDASQSPQEDGIQVNAQGSFPCFSTLAPQLSSPIREREHSNQNYNNHNANLDEITKNTEKIIILHSNETKNFNQPVESPSGLNLFTADLSNTTDFCVDQCPSNKKYNSKNDGNRMLNIGSGDIRCAAPCVVPSDNDCDKRNVVQGNNSEYVFIRNKDVEPKANIVEAIFCQFDYPSKQHAHKISQNNKDLAFEDNFIHTNTNESSNPGKKSFSSREVKLSIPERYLKRDTTKYAIQRTDAAAHNDFVKSKYDYSGSNITPPKTPYRFDFGGLSKGLLSSELHSKVQSKFQSVTETLQCILNKKYEARQKSRSKSGSQTHSIKRPKQSTASGTHDGSQCRDMSKQKTNSKPISTSQALKSKIGMNLASTNLLHLGQVDKQHLSNQIIHRTNRGSQSTLTGNNKPLTPSITKKIDLTNPNTYSGNSSARETHTASGTHCTLQTPQPSSGPLQPNMPSGGGGAFHSCPSEYTHSHPPSLPLRPTKSTSLATIASIKPVPTTTTPRQPANPRGSSQPRQSTTSLQQCKNVKSMARIHASSRSQLHESSELVVGREDRASGVDNWAKERANSGKRGNCAQKSAAVSGVKKLMSKGGDKLITLDIRPATSRFRGSISSTSQNPVVLVSNNIKNLIPKVAEYVRTKTPKSKESLKSHTTSHYHTTESDVAPLQFSQSTNPSQSQAQQSNNYPSETPY